MLHPPRDAHPLEVVCHDLSARFLSVWLDHDLGSGGVVTCGPVVEHPWDVMNPASLFRHTQYEVVILRSVGP